MKKKYLFLISFAGTFVIIFLSSNVFYPIIESQEDFLQKRIYLPLWVGLLVGGVALLLRRVYHHPDEFPT